MEARLYNLKKWITGDDPLDLPKLVGLSNAADSFVGIHIATKSIWTADGKNTGQFEYVAKSTTDPKTSKITTVDASASRPIPSWNSRIAAAFGDRYLSEDVGNGQPGNGTESDQIAHQWRGRGILQMTHLNAYAQFFLDLSRKSPDLVPELNGVSSLDGVKKLLIANAKDAIKNNTMAIVDYVAEKSIRGRTLSALSGAFDWASKALPSKIAAGAKLNDYALQLAWGKDSVSDAEKSNYGNITRRVNAGSDKADARWISYRGNAKNLLFRTYANYLNN